LFAKKKYLMDFKNVVASITKEVEFFLSNLQIISAFLNNKTLTKIAIK